jgi:arsenite methyltransferase
LRKRHQAGVESRTSVMATTVDTVELETEVKEMCRHVAQETGGDCHFELGEPLALRVGYDADRLRKVPAGESVLDPGSGSGMDAVYAAGYVGPSGRVSGIRVRAGAA